MTIPPRILVLVLVLLAATGTIMPTRAADAASTVLVTGANRGIGLEFVKQYAAKGWRVIATARDRAGAPELQALAKATAHGEVSVERLDVTNDVPHLYFVHFWANDDAVTLARSLRAALDHVNVAPRR